MFNSYGAIAGLRSSPFLQPMGEPIGKPPGGGSLEAYLVTALPNLPSGRRSAVAAAINSAASGQSFTAQGVIDRIAAVRFHSFNVADGCLFTDTVATTLATTEGDAVASIRPWAGSTIQWTQAIGQARPLVEGVKLRFGSNPTRRVLETTTAFNAVTSAAMWAIVASDFNPGFAGGARARLWSFSGSGGSVWVNEASLGFLGLLQSGTGNRINFISAASYGTNDTLIQTSNDGANVMASINLTNAGLASAGTLATTFATLGGNASDRWEGTMRCLLTHNAAISGDMQLALRRFVSFYYGLSLY